MLSNNTLAYRFFNNVKSNPDKTALIYNSKHITYKDLSELVNYYTDILYGNDIKPNELIGVKIKDSIDFVSIMLATSSLGIGIVPIDNTTPEDSVKARLDELNVRYILSDDKNLNNIDCNNKKETVYPELTGNETYIVSLTSGSTGKPKPIELTQSIKLERINQHIKMFNLSENDVIIASTPLYHSLAERLVLLSLLLNATCIIIDEFKAHEWFTLVNKEKATFTITDSSQMALISQMLYSPFVPDISSLHSIVSSSSTLENHVRKELINKLNCDVYEMYGTSETSTLTLINLKKDENISSVGKVLDFADIIIDEKDEKGIGEILAKSSLLFKGYYNNEELTKKSFKNDYFITGDLGKLDENNNLYYSGRKDELIKTNGINIYPLEIENILNELEGIKECTVFSYHDDFKGNVLAAAVVSESLDEETIRNYCKDKLSRLLIPDKIFIVDSLPKNAMGKLMKNKIYEYVIRNMMKEGS